MHDDPTRTHPNALSAGSGAQPSVQSRAFNERMRSLLNAAALSLMVGIGHQLGLFALLAGRPPQTLDQIARASRHDIRYLEAWLAALVVGRILQYDARSQCYSVPPHHSGALTGAEGCENLAAHAQLVVALANLEQTVIARFRDGAGIAPAAYERFHGLQAERCRAHLEAHLVTGLLPPSLHQKLTRGGAVLDVGIGFGRAGFVLARHFPDARVLGLEGSVEGAASARAECRAERLPNLRIAMADVADLDGSSTYDLIAVFGALAEMGSPRRHVSHLRALLRPAGWLILSTSVGWDPARPAVEHPLGALLAATGVLHRLPLTLARDPGAPGIQGEAATLLDELRIAGFRRIEHHPLGDDSLTTVITARVGGPGSNHGS